MLFVGNYCIDAYGRAVDCAAAEIPDLEVEFDKPPVERDKTTNTNIPR